jgi:hypothetical protein
MEYDKKVISIYQNEGNIFKSYFKLWVIVIILSWHSYNDNDILFVIFNYGSKLLRT